MKKISHYAFGLLFVGLLTYSQSSFAALTVDASWQVEPSSDGSILSPRHEATGVVVGDAIYLLGGRGSRSVERYSTDTQQWDDLGAAPLELHHMQAVALSEKIYVFGAFTCCYPIEELVEAIHVFDTVTATWSVEGTQPLARLRGSAAAIVRDNKIYLVGGNSQGHDGGAVAWFDEYDPSTEQWRILPDAPNARDHFVAVLVDDQLVAAAGRETVLPNPSANPVLTTDIYDFTTGLWRSGAPIPTARAGVVSVGYDQHVIVAGGEINTSNDALDVVEAYDVASDTWQSLPSMTVGRHGGGGAIIGSKFYVMSGSVTIGGSPSSESPTIEFLQMPAIVISEPEPETETETTPKKSGALGLFALLVLMGISGVRAQRLRS